MGAGEPRALPLKFAHSIKEGGRIAGLLQSAHLYLPKLSVVHFIRSSRRAVVAWCVGRIQARRRRAMSPAPPRPRSASEVGSGTATPSARTIQWPGRPKLSMKPRLAAGIVPARFAGLTAPGPAKPIQERPARSGSVSSRPAGNGFAGLTADGIRTPADRVPLGATTPPPGMAYTAKLLVSAF